MAKEYNIGEFLKRIKRPISLIDDQEYKLVTIKMNHNGVVLRQLKKGALIKSKMFEVKQDDFILSGIDARNGAFGIVPEELVGAIVTNDFWYFEIDENIISKKLFLELTSTTWFDEICKRGSDGTTQRIRLQKDKFFNQKVLLPEKHEQDALLNNILSFKKKQIELGEEIQTQKQLFVQLKQSILQEAIQGKLTEEWRKENPDVEAACLLIERIKKRRNQWIKESKKDGYKEASTVDKKLKKLEKLPIITLVDPLPEKWAWTSIINVAQLIVDCHNKTAPYVNSGIPLVRTTNIRNGVLDIVNTKFVTEETYKFWSKRCIPIPGDILFTREAPVGEGAIIPDDTMLCMGQRTMLIRTYNDLVLRKYLLFMITSPDFLKRISAERKGAMVGHLRVGDVENFLIPIPPFEEQNVIVQKVETLMQKCQVLEQEIKTSEANAQMLMQAVLKEAFESKEEVLAEMEQCN